VDEQRSRGHLADHPKLRLSATLIGMTAAILGVTYLLVPSCFPAKLAGQRTTALPTAGQEKRPETSSNATGRGGTDTPIGVGSCLLTDAKATVCATQHDLEIIGNPTDPCAQDGLVRYLGGIPGTEVLITGPRRASDGVAAGYCVTPLPSGISTVRSARGSLTTGRAADAWRRCTDANTADDRVSCSVPHTGEYMGLAPGTGDCVKSFEDYARISFEEVSDHLALSRVQPSEEPTISCLVSALGNDKLSASIRDLRTRALPLS